ncbi:hypothetical protein TWF694_006358 [Orbilia ellipsospora]|uniref:Ankyrin n=1 Tax=Orbilia ellipsospora TaxID=2528407 RepID=A0AAV9XRK8_9PEZI
MFGYTKKNMLTIEESFLLLSLLDLPPSPGLPGVAVNTPFLGLAAVIDAHPSLKRKHTRANSITDIKRIKTDAEEIIQRSQLLKQDERIWRATASGNVETLISLFESLPQEQRARAANLVHEEHQVPPLLTTLCPRTAGVLLDYGADPKFSGLGTFTALDRTLLEENLPIMTEILRTERGRDCLTIKNTLYLNLLGLRKSPKGEDPTLDEELEQKHGLLEKPLMVALHKKNLEMTELILKTAKEHPGLNIFMGKPWKQEAHKVIRQGDIRFLKLFLDYGLDPNHIDLSGNPLLCTVFWDAALLGEHLCIPWVKLLLERGANVNQTGRLDVSILQHSITADNVEVAKLLLENGADLSTMSQATGLRPIHSVRSPGMLKLLLNHGADIKALGRDGQTLAHRLVHDSTMIQYLIDQGPEAREILSKPDSLGRAPLYFAINNDKPSLAAIALLLPLTDLSLPMQTSWYPKGVFRTKKERETYLHVAVRSDEFEIFEMVLDEYKKRKLNLNARNLALESPLILAALQNKINYFTSLLDNGANLFLPFPTPIFSPDAPVVSHLPLTILAADYTYDDIIDEIRLRTKNKYWADIDSEGNGPLHYAACSLDEDRIYNVLSENKYDPNAVNSAGDTPLHCAINSMRSTCEVGLMKGVMQTLILAGATLYAENAKGQTVSELFNERRKAFLQRVVCGQDCRACHDYDD